MAEQDFEIDPHNGNRILRNQLRTDRSTGQRTLVDVFTPQQGMKWEKPTRLLKADEKWPPDPVATPPDLIPPGTSESDSLRAGILAWLKNGDPEQ